MMRLSPIRYGVKIVAPSGFNITLSNTDKAATITLSGGDLIATKTAVTAHKFVRATVGVSSGKWYWEVKLGSGNINSKGIAGISQSVDSVELQLGATNGYELNGMNGFVYHLGDTSPITGGVSYGSTFTTADIIGVALDMDNGKIFFSKNNIWMGLSDPVTGSNQANISTLSGDWFPSVGLYDANSSASVQFTAASQTYSPPSGYLSIGI